MECKYDDGNGWCTGRYSGFGCIKALCEYYLNRDEEGLQCSEVALDGVYCHKFNRFFCAGKENCYDSLSYERKFKMSVL